MINKIEASEKKLVLLAGNAIVNEGKIIELKMSVNMAQNTKTLKIQPVFLTISSGFWLEKKRVHDVNVKEQKLKMTLKNDPLPKECKKVLSVGTFIGSPWLRGHMHLTEN